MRRALSKPHLRLAGVDDGAFSRRQRRAPIAAVAWSGPDRVEGIVVGEVEVDGRDATDRIRALVRALPQFDGVRAILLDGIAVGGFNLIDLPALARSLSRPVVAVTRRPPDLAKIHRALAKYFDDASRRRRLLARAPLFEVPTPGEPLWAACSGCSRSEAVAVVRRSAVLGLWPEPLRLAHLVAHAVGTKGRVARGAGRTLKRGARVAPSSGL